LALRVKEVTGDWRKLHNEELHDLNTPHQILLRVEGKTDQRNAQINFSLINLLLLKLLRHVSATQLEPMAPIG